MIQTGFKDAVSELGNLVDLLHLEMEEDIEQFRKNVQNRPLSERKKEGFSWYPVQTIQTGFAIGEKAFVVVERHPLPDNQNQFRAGSTVQLFCEQTGIEDKHYTGVVNYIDKNRMKIILNNSDLPDWLNAGMVGVDLLFDNRTYQEMLSAIERVQKSEKNRLAELRDKLLGYRNAEPIYFIPSSDKFDFLNDSQHDAVLKMHSTTDFLAIHGPPGTGKTTTLVEGIRQLCQREATILVTAPSNTAADLLTEKLAEKGLNVVRIGHISRVDEAVLHHTLDYQLATHPESKHIKKVRMEAAEARRQAKRFRRNFGGEERAERKMLYAEAKDLSEWAIQLEDKLIDQLLTGANVITCTLVGAAHPLLHRRTFRTVVIDEAAQALEAAAWIAISKGSRVIFAGDPLQLPPTVKSYKAGKGGLSKTLLEKVMERTPNVHLLDTQYRMNELIMEFSNRQFYDGLLTADKKVAHHLLDIADNQPIIFVDTAGCGFDEQADKTGQSKYNSEEFYLIREHLYQLADAYLGKEMPTIALISPYREQVNFMLTTIREEALLSTLPIRVDTIDGFQGQENEIVIISLVRSNGKGEIGFLSDYRRMNVAMTRAKKQLIVVGDSATIGQDAFYGKFIEYCESIGAYRSAWEYLAGK